MAAGKLDDDDISAINVTPLVDVVLVLLVIFMITAPVLYHGALDVNLPEAGSGEVPARPPLEVVMDRDGAVQVEDRWMTQEQLGEWVARHRCDAAMILADRKVEHGKVITLIDILKSRGVRKFSFGVEVQP
jgi:biopolymer transport protein ExbD